MVSVAGIGLQELFAQLRSLSRATDSPSSSAVTASASIDLVVPPHPKPKPRPSTEPHQARTSTSIRSDPKPYNRISVGGGLCFRIAVSLAL